MFGGVCFRVRREPTGQRCLKLFSVFLIEGALVDQLQMIDNEDRALTS